MKAGANTRFIRWYILGAIGAVLMAVGDWLLGCVPLQAADMGMFNRAYYLSGAYGLWRPVLTVGTGAIGGFLDYFMVKALNADIDAKYRKTKAVQYLCGIALVALVLTVLSFAVFHITALGVVFAAASVLLAALLCWMAWIRRQYAFGKGGMMERVHQTILSSLEFDGNGSLLEVGCGSGALSIRAALTWPKAKITGLDYWGAMYSYSKALCEKNAASAVSGMLKSKTLIKSSCSK